MSKRAQRFRGRSRTHGRGKKGGRGAGLRGGRGNAGLHKHKYIYTVKYDPDHFGRKGFKRPQKIIKNPEAINFREINQRFQEFKEKGYIMETEGELVLDLASMKIDKLLSHGELTTKLNVKVRDVDTGVSKGARKKIENMGGKILSA